MIQTPVTGGTPAARTKDPAARLAITRWTELKSAAQRPQHERLWEDLARLIRPQRGGFGLTDPAGRVLEKPLSSAPIYAASAFAASLYGTASNPAEPWFGFATPDEDVNAWHPMRAWLDEVTRVTRTSFTPAISTFYPASQQVYSDLAVFGNSAQYDEIIPAEKKILDVTLSLAEVVYDIDGFGRVCEVVRRFMLKPAAALRMFAGRGALPPRVHELAAKGDTGDLTFYQHVMLNDGFQPGKLGPRGKRWVSRYACEAEECLVRESGYDEMPFYAPRWEVDSGHVYGTGPGFIALAATRVHNRMTDAIIRGAQRAADPTILAPDKGDWPLNGRIVPGAVLYGAMDLQGRAMVRPLDVTGAVNLTLQERQALIEEVKDAFHYALLQLSGRTGMTATEVMTINEERQRLWGPHMGRVQEEYLQPKIARRFAMLWKASQLPPPPEGLPKDLALNVTYESAAAAAMRSQEGNAALRVLQDILPLAQMDPRVMDRVDPDGLVEVLAAARGAPARMLRSREAADQLAQQRQQAQAAQAGLGAAQAGAGILKDLAAAGMGDPAAAAGQGGGA